MNSDELGVLALRWVSGDANIPPSLYQVVEYSEDDEDEKEADVASEQVYKVSEVLFLQWFFISLLENANAKQESAPSVFDSAGN